MTTAKIAVSAALKISFVLSSKMANLIESISRTNKYLFEELAYPVTRDWPLVGSPLPTIGIVIAYVYFCTRLGPQLMQNRKPFNLKICLLIYNLVQVMLNLYTFYEALKYIYIGPFNLMCQNVDDPTALRVKESLSVGYVFYMIKYLDLLDTVFFVLRKSNRQITSLHLHHHSIMPLGGWLGITYYPGGPAAIIILLNSCVHSVMYTYYLLSGLGEEFKKYLWWKKYVTILQLVQFSLYGIHSLNSLFYDCGYPTTLKCLILLYSIIFMNMFGQFYYKAYIVNAEPELNNKLTNGKKPVNKVM